MSMSMPVTARWLRRCCLMLAQGGRARICWSSSRVASWSAICRCWTSTSLDEPSASVGLTLVERQQAWLAELAVRVTARVAGPTPIANPDSEDPFERDPIDARGEPGRRDVGDDHVRGADPSRCGAGDCRVVAVLPGGDGGRVHGLPASADRLPRRSPLAGLGQVGVAAVDARVASRIKGQSWSAFRRTLRRAVLGREPGSGARRAHEGGASTGGWRRSTSSTQ